MAMAAPEPAHDEADRGLWAIAALRQRVAAIAREIAGVRRASDPEPLHRMRVASRRARAALSLVAGRRSARRARAWRADLKRLTRALGEARDLDVHIAFVAEFLARGVEPGWRPGLERLLLRLRQRRERRQRRVVAALDRLDRRETLAAIAAWADGRLSRDPDGAAGAAGAAARCAAREALAPLVNDLAARSASLRDPHDEAGHHALRIAAKRLRYALEIAAGLDADAVREALRAARETQRRLGEIHDCDVWVRMLPEFLARERRRTLRYFGAAAPFAPLKAGLLALREERARRRAAVFGEFQAYWAELEARGVWSEARHAPRDAGPAAPAPAEETP